MATESTETTRDVQAARQRRPRPTQTGVVTSDVRDKTITVTLSYLARHPKYGKALRRCTKLHAHDEKNEAAVGDVVEIVECRPISKTKAWRLLRVITRASTGGAS
jgi:small subunit ribosomal protein S17